MSDYIDAPKASAPRNPRLLKGHEIVRHGDFVEGKEAAGGYVPWDGPSGFRADAFIKPIYRGGVRRPRAALAGKGLAVRS